MLWNVFLWEPSWKSAASGQTSEPAHLEASRTLTKAGRRDQSGRSLRHQMVLSDLHFFNW